MMMIASYLSADMRVLSHAISVILSCESYANDSHCFPSVLWLVAARMLARPKATNLPLGNCAAGRSRGTRVDAKREAEVKPTAGRLRLISISLLAELR